MTWTWGLVRALECSNTTRTLYVECCRTARKDGGKGHGVSKVFKKQKNFLGLKLKGSITQEKGDVPGHELNEADSHPVMSCGNYFKWRLTNRPGLEYFCRKNITILTRELQNVWDCRASISQNRYCGFFFDYLIIKRTSTSKRNQPNKSTRRCYSICLLFQI